MPAGIYARTIEIRELMARKQREYLANSSEANARNNQLLVGMRARKSMLQGNEAWKYNQQRGVRATAEKRHREGLSELHKQHIREYWESLTPQQRKERALNSIRKPEGVAKVNILNRKRLLGVARPEEQKRKQSKTMKLLWGDADYAKRVATCQNRLPNKAELCLKDILDKCYPSNWEYCGDGKVWINGRNPDFININGEKCVIELFGGYWHTKKAKTDNDSEYRVAHYKKYGFNCVVIWDYELHDVSKLLSRIEGECYGNN